MATWKCARASPKTIWRIWPWGRGAGAAGGTTQTFIGHVWQVSPVIDPATRQGLARIQLAYDPAIRPGGFAGAGIQSGMVEAPVLPESALQADNTAACLHRRARQQGRAARGHHRSGHP
jgi:hypothetical protein